MNLVKNILSLLSVIRGYNIIVLIVAQYLTAIFILSKDNSVSSVLTDLHLFYIVLSTISVVAGGYIINNFYDLKADQINRPIKYKIDNILEQEHQLALYFTFNFIGFIASYLVSWRACLFFSTYIFSIWFYSHKLKKYPLVGLVSASILTIIPFFVLLVYYKNFSGVIFVHATFLFTVILIRELIKELVNLKGSIVNNYKTFTVTYGENHSKQLIYLLVFINLISVAVILNYDIIHNMKYYFYCSVIVLILFMLLLKKSSTKNQYRHLHNLLKLLLLTGVISIIFTAY